MIKKLLAISFLILTPMYIVGQTNVSKKGSTAAQFLEIPVGAVPTGMGGAFVSVAKDASALYWNVAGIASIQKYEVVAIHTDWIAETNFDFAGLVLPLGDFGVLGFSFTALSMSDMKVRTVEMPEGTGEFFGASDIAIGISYARVLSDRFSIGFTAKYIQQSIWHMRSNAFALDIGTVFRTDLLGGMRIGASITNFGTELKLSGRDTRYFISVNPNNLGTNDRIPVNVELDSWPLPLSIQLGVSTEAINANDYKLTVAVDALHPNNDKESINFGIEFSYMNFLFIRGGYNSLFLKDAEGGLSFGAGVNSKLIFSETVAQFDYAYRDFGRLKNVHVFSIGLVF